MKSGLNVANSYLKFMKFLSGGSNKEKGEKEKFKRNIATSIRLLFKASEEIVHKDEFKDVKTVKYSGIESFPESLSFKCFTQSWIKIYNKWNKFKYFYFFSVLLISMKFGATLIIEILIVESGKIS